MTEKCRYCYVLDNNEPTFYDLNKKDILQMYQVEDLLNSLLEENENLKKENEQLKKVAKEFAQNQTQHNLWKLRTVLKDSDME